MENKKYVLVGFIVLIILGIIVWFYFFNVDDSKVDNKFGLDTLFLKVAVSEGGTATKYIQIEDVKDISVNVNQISEVVSFGDESPKKTEDGKYDVEIIFNAEDAEPDIYLGELEFSSYEDVRKVPIILEVQTELAVFDANVNLYPQGQDAIPGQRLNAEIKIFDLVGMGRSSIKLTYFVKDFKGNTIISESENIVIDDSSYSFSKSLNIPENIELGNYVLGVVVKYVDSIGTQSVGTSSVFFKVSEEEESEAFGDKGIILIVIIFGFFFLIFLILFIYSLFSRDKLLRELQNQYKRELRKQKELIVCAEKRDLTKLETPLERKTYKKEIKKVEKDRLKALAGMQKTRIKEFKKIKKTGKVNNLKKQLREWKLRGYDTGILDKKYKIPDTSGIKKKIKNWKKQGYNTNVLNKHLKVF